MPKLICASGASSELGGNARLFSVLITCQDWDSSGNFELNKFFFGPADKSQTKKWSSQKIILTKFRLWQDWNLCFPDNSWVPLSTGLWSQTLRVRQNLGFSFWSMQSAWNNGRQLVGNYLGASIVSSQAPIKIPLP